MSPMIGFAMRSGSHQTLSPSRRAPSQRGSPLPRCSSRLSQGPRGSSLGRRRALPPMRISCLEGRRTFLPLGLRTMAPVISFPRGAPRCFHAMLILWDAPRSPNADSRPSCVSPSSTRSKSNSW